MPPTSRALGQTHLDGLPAPVRGKVRDVYDLGDTLLLVATDRLSAYDHVLDPPIPGKGRILNQLSNFWFGRLASIVPNAVVATDPADFPSITRAHHEILRGRSVLMRKARVVPFECVARGYLAGSAFREYEETGRACGHDLPEGLLRASRLPEPLFTPATKAASGHDVNVDFAAMVEGVGRELAEELRQLTLRIYAAGVEHVGGEGLLLADTKFEFGLVGDELMLVDEVMTPDSSRYWEESAWQPGTEPASFDKQFVRNWLDAQGWDHEGPPPKLPAEVVDGTRARYQEAFRRITGRDPEL